LLTFDLVSSEELQRGSEGAQFVDGHPDVARRALLAFLKLARDATEAPQALFLEHLQKQYVALLSNGSVGAVYRVRNDLQLKRMRRVPKSVAYAAELFRRANHV
jgi:hypothetical protein